MGPRLTDHSQQDLIGHTALYTVEGGNLDCVHPAQCVLDALCGDNKDAYAQQLQNWFESYADKRGLKAKMFKPLTSCVSWLMVLDSRSKPALV